MSSGFTNMALTFYTTHKCRSIVDSGGGSFLAGFHGCAEARNFCSDNDFKTNVLYESPALTTAYRLCVSENNQRIASRNAFGLTRG